MDISDYKDTIIRNIGKVHKDANIEMEAVYKTNVDYPLDRTTFNRVISYIKGYKEAKLFSNGSTLDIFVPDKDDSLRYTIYGDGAINTYCKSNNLSTLKSGSYTLERKSKVMKPVDINNYNIRFNFKKELEEKIDIEVFNLWPTINKLFRYKKRYSFKTIDGLFSIDFTIVKSSNNKTINEPNSIVKKRNVKDSMRRFVIKPKNVVSFDEWYDLLGENDEVELRGKKYEEMIPFKSIQSSNVLLNDMKYEIEIEYLGNKKNGYKEKYEVILQKYINHIEFILKAIQNNAFIVSQGEKAEFRKEYYSLLKLRRFSGPQPTALELKHVSRHSYSDYKDIVNIRRNYCVTDKADGERNLAYVMKNGNVMLFNRKNEIKSLGCKMPGFEGTLLDGEYIMKDKNGNSILMFMVFDMYFNKNRDIRSKPFFRTEEDKESNPNDLSRYEQLTDFFKKVDIQKSIDGIIVAQKEFYFGDVAKYDDEFDKEITRIENELKLLDSNEVKYSNLQEYLDKLKADTKIFSHSKALLEKEYIYKTDGLIYTPINLPVGGSFDESKKAKYDGRWYECFKWKPPLETTIDFRIYFKKNKENKGEDLISYVTNGDEVIEYKTAILYVGYNPKIHTQVNSCRVLNEELTFDEGYSNVPFHPYNPYVKNIEFAHIPLKNGTAYTEEKQIIREGSIVEFRYNKVKGDGFWWEPMRIRNVISPNDFITAINNWRTLHNPVLGTMISSGVTPTTDDSYYINNKKRKNIPTKALGDFHSFVKKTLLTKVGNKAKNLLDLCTGRSGDMNHWKDLNLDNILCVEMSRDNIENKENGGCNRILNSISENKKNIFQNIMMIWGDVSMPLENGSAGNDDLNKYYLNVLYGNIEKSLIENSKLQRLYGVYSEKRFDIISCQFSIHYFFENSFKLNNYLKNVSDNLNSGGKFIGTTLDGEIVFDKLKDTNVLIGDNYNELLWKIIKNYKKDTFVGDESSLNYPIDVYINSIGKTITEWLVNFKYLENKCEEYGMKLVESKLFSEVFDELSKSKKVYGEAMSMNQELKDLSFMYKYFIFEKI